ncbi:MAG: aminodeoxychorismate/anthranilate synthase component II [Firmicutes bacterium]|nr:aminodeoxychorismate/anthranilate synthase component II [Bacillota bacterium]
MIVIIDNYDSFTYNLYQYVGEINKDVAVFRNDAITIEELKELDISHIIISPGPGFPKDAGITIDVIKTFGEDIPILGVCLGHQAIGEAFGGKVVHAKEMVHGKTSDIYHNGLYIFNGLENLLTVTRYHSLVLDKKSIPNKLEVIAESNDGEIMALKHRAYPIFGVQFHPESFLTDGGRKILRNFIKGGIKNVKVCNG